MGDFNVPPKISIGFQNRSDTYTGKLGFVVRTSKNGKISSEKSWNGWRDDKIKPLVVDNEPTEGFVLNKGVGGARNSYSWNARNEYIRVYDPRGFEFEITVPNLLFILQECSAIKGKGLEGEFVYAWCGSAKVMLLPIDSQEYKSSFDLETLKAKKVNKKEMVAGCTYLTKKSEQVIYLGRFEWGEIKYNYYSSREYTRKKRHIFVYVDKIDKDGNSYEKYWVQDGFTKLSERLTNEPISTFAEIFESFSKSQYAGAPSELVTRSKIMTFNKWCQQSKRCWLSQDDGSFLSCYAQRDYQRYYQDRDSDLKKKECYNLHKDAHVSLFNGKFKIQGVSGNLVRSGLTKEEVESMPFVELSVKLTNGAKIKLNY